MSKKEKEQLEKRKFNEYVPIESHLAIQPQKSLFEKDINRYSETQDLLKIFKQAIEYIEINNKYDKSGNLVYSVYKHDLECMTLLGNMEYNEKNIDAENTERIAKITQEIAKAIGYREQENHNPITRFLRKNQDK